MQLKISNYKYTILAGFAAYTTLIKFFQVSDIILHKSYPNISAKQQTRSVRSVSIHAKTLGKDMNYQNNEDDTSEQIIKL